ncbi:MAG: TonB-dependent receptor [Bdellovibrionales bacterium]|nr:TonB-dependent receptor [Bdellovibrionales bacterium]
MTTVKCAKAAALFGAAALFFGISVTSMPRALASSSQALIDVYVFNEEAAATGVLTVIPAPDVAVSVIADPIQVGMTDASGHIRFSVSPGEVDLQVVHASEKFRVFADRDRAARAIVRLFKPTGTMDTSNDASVAIAMKAEVESTSKQQVDQLNRQKKQLRLLVRGQSGEPLSGAKIFVDGSEDALTTDSHGVVETEAAVDSSVTVLHSRFELERVGVGGVAVTEIEVKLRPASQELEEFRVLAPRVRGGVGALIEVRRKNRGVAEVLGSEQMARSGDSDAAGSLKRVTGLTLVGGRYVYVRGLGERYSSILLNDATLSSPEPARRVVPLDLFPTSVVESLVIEKSYSPELPGEFGGGTIRIGTKPIPDSFFSKISLGAAFGGGAEPETYRGGAMDGLGFDDGTRALPSSVAVATADGRRLKEQNSLFPQGFTPIQLQEMGRSFSNTWSAERANEAPMPSFNFSIGNSSQITDGLTVGGQGAFLYGSDFDTTEKQAKTLSLGSGGMLSPDAERTVKESSREIRTGLTGDAGVSLKTVAGEQKISSTVMLLRNTEDQVKTATELNANGSYRSTGIEWVERQLWVRQLRGEHEIALSDLFMGLENRVRWRLSRADAARVAPDVRDHRYILENGQYLLSTRADGNQRSYSQLNDQTSEVGGDWRVGRSISEIGRVDFNIGFASTDRERSSGMRRFHFRDMRPASSNLDLSQSAEEIFVSDNIGSEGFQILETTRETDTYRAAQSLVAMSYTVDWKPQDRLRFSAGWRDERSRQDVLTYNLYDPDNMPIRAGLETVDRLPMWAAAWEFRPTHQLRATYSETVSRPDFKELSVAPYTDEETGQEVVGNNRLKSAVIKNIDFRYEFYPSSDESVSFGFFRKDFEQPIEQIIRPGSDGTLRTFENAKRAENTGVEFESRIRLRRLANSLRRLTVAGNVALIDSKIELSDSNSGVQTSNSRALQGQSPWVVNLQFLYDHRAANVASGLMFNMIGPRIREAAAGGLPDIIEESFAQLDWVSSWDFLSNASVQLKAKNILDPEASLTQGGVKTLAWRRGRSFSLNLSARF